jgi:transposase
VKRAIKELIIEKHGIPKTILADSGQEFKNDAILEMSKFYNFSCIYGSPYHHETTGSVERVNQTLMNALRKLCNFGALYWTKK